MGLSFVATAPGRCGIIGNPTDIYGGRVLSCSIPARAKCRLTFGGENLLPEDLRLWAAATDRFPVNGPVKVEWSTEIPRSSGLSGSTALLAATLTCILQSLDMSPDLATPIGLSSMAELVRDIEINAAKIVGGYQDAYMIVNGGLQFMNFAGKHPIHPGPPAVLTRLNNQLPFLLVTTGVERMSGSVHGPMSKRWLEGDTQVVGAMDKIADLADVGVAALKAEDWGSLGRAMTENHRLVADLGGSGDAIDTLIDQCIRHGAIGAKLAGAGLGGTVIALTLDADRLEAKLKDEGYTRFMRPSIEPGLKIEYH